MGIKKNIVFKGIQLENVYHNVSIKNISKNDNKVFEVNYIVHAYSDTKEELQRDNFVCEYNLSGDNVIAQAYNDLKTRVEYLGAIDVLENAKPINENAEPINENAEPINENAEPINEKNEQDPLNN